MTGGDAIAPPEPMKFGADTLGSGLQLSVLDTVIEWITRVITSSTNVTWNGSGCCGNSQKSSGKWQYTLRCTVSQSGNNTVGERSWANIGLSKRHKSAIASVGQASYDYALSSWCTNSGNTGSIYKVNDGVYTLFYGGAGATHTVGDYITVLVDFDAGKVWFAINGTVLEGDPNAGTGQSFSFTPNIGLVPAVTLATGSSIRKPGTYLVEQAIIYPTWPSFFIWDNQDESASDDPLSYDENTSFNSLLWVADGIANGTTSLTDLSPLANTITNNLATVDAIDDVLNGVINPCGGGCLDFDGNDFFTISTLTPFQFGTGDFCIEFYIKINGAPATEETVYESRNSSASTLMPTILIRTNGTMRVYYSGAYRLEGLVVVTDNNWHHVALVRSGDNLGLFIDGVRVQNITGVSASSFTANALRVGANYIVGGYFNGSLNFIRVTKGNSRYGTSSFVPPRYWLAS